MELVSLGHKALLGGYIASVLLTTNVGTLSSRDEARRSNEEVRGASTKQRSICSGWALNYCYLVLI